MTIKCHGRDGLCGFPENICSELYRSRRIGPCGLRVRINCGEMNYAVSAVEGLSPNTRSGEVDLVVHDPGNRPFCWIENMYFVPRLGGMSGWQGNSVLE